jgi:hypothetical protein
MRRAPLPSVAAIGRDANRWNAAARGPKARTPN